jgi:MFS family permease
MFKLQGVVLLLAGLVFLAHFNRVSISVAANAHFIGEGKLSEVQMGTVYSAFLFVYTALMLPGGWFIDRVGPRRALALMGVGLGTLTVVTGLLGFSGLSVAAMFAPLIAIRCMAGATSVPLHPGAARAVSLWVPAARRSTANGIVTAGALFGIALTYPVFGGLMDATGWPTAFGICGLTMALVAISWWIATAGFEVNRSAEHRPTLREMLGLLKNRSLVLLALSYGAIGYVQYLFFYWIEYWFKNELKAGSEASRDSAALIAAAMGVGMILGGLASDAACAVLGRVQGCRLIAVGGMGLGAAFSLLALGTRDTAAVTMWFALAFACLGLCEGIFWTTAPMLEPKAGGLACAVVNTGGNGFGLLAPLFTPIIGREFGWDSAILVACAACAVGGLLWFGIRVESKS